MKKLFAVAFVTACLAGAFVHAQSVESRNAVGYVKIDVDPGKFFLASVPFYGVGDASPRTITEVVGDQLTGTAGFIGGSDYIIKFTPGPPPNGQKYVLFWKSTSDNTWRDTTDLFNPTTNTLNPGDGFFIQNNQSTAQTVFVMGEVPSQITSGTNTLPLKPGFNMVSYAYPNQIPITNLTLSTIVNPGPSGDQLVTFTTGQTYKVYFYDNVGFGGPGTQGWKTFENFTSPATSDVLVPGQGVFFNRTGVVETNWVEVKQYSYP